MRAFQLASLFRQVIGLKISEAEIMVKDLYIPAPDPLIDDAMALAAFLFDDQGVAMTASAKEGLMNAKAKGSRNERRTIVLVSAQGYACTKSGETLGVFDMIRIGTDDVVLCQVKSNRWPTSVEMEAIRSFPAPANCRRITHRWRDCQAAPDVRRYERGLLVNRRRLFTVIFCHLLSSFCAMKVASLKDRSFVDYYFLAKRNVVRAAEIAGVPLRTARRIIARPEIKALIEERQAELSAVAMASAGEIVGILLRQARGDIADLMPDEPLLQQARKNGVSRQIKKIKIKETIRKVIKVPGSDEEVQVIERNVELETYSPQDASKTLAKIFGLDSHAELERGRTAIKMYCEMKDCGPEEAIIALAPHVPAVIKVKDEFVRRPRLTPGE